MVDDNNASGLGRHRSSVFRILALASRTEVCFLCLGVAGSMIQGALMPTMTIVFGSLAGEFADVEAGRITDAEFLRSLRHFTLCFVYLAIAEFVGSFAMWIGLTIAGEGITNKLRRTLLLALFRKGVAYLDEAGTGETADLLGGEADKVQDAFSSKLGRVIAAVTGVLVAFAVAFSRSWRLSLIMSSGLLAFAAAGGIGASFVTKYTKASLDAQAKASALAQEAISGISCVIANLAQTHLSTKYASLLSTGLTPAVLARAFGELMIATIVSIATCLFGLAFWQGSRFYVNGHADFSDIIIVLLAILLGTASLGLVGPMAQAVIAGLTAANEIFVVIDKCGSSRSGPEAGIEPGTIEGTVRFEDVSFAYPTRPDMTILKAFNLIIPARKTTALVGASGCGKSTIVKLVQRFYDPSSGTVSLDGTPLSSLNVKWLRKHIAVVSQEPDLFNTTIYNNIAYGLMHSDCARDEGHIMRQVHTAAQQADIHDSIMRMPQGYETIVGERGSKLSGGQRQRIAISRALIAESQILLLDEPTSALDTVSENFVRETLAAAGRDRTVIIIAHQLSTIQDADNIVVLGPDGIVEQGQYADLMASRAAFFKLRNTQMLTEPADFLSASLPRKWATGDADVTLRPVASFSTETNSKQSVADSSTNLIGRNAPISGGNHLQLETPSFASRQVHSRKEVWRQLLSYNRESTWLLASGLMWALITGCSSTVQAYLFASAVTTFSEAIDDNARLLKNVDFWAAMLVTLAGATWVASVFRGAFLAVCSEGFMLRVRRKAFEQILRQDMTFFDSSGSQTLSHLITTEIGQMNSLTPSVIAQFVAGFAALLSAVALSIAVNWRLGLVFTAAIPILLVSGHLHGVFASKREQKSRQSFSDAVGMASEAIDCMATVVSLSLENHIDCQFWQLITSRARESIHAAYKACAIYALSQMSTYLCFAGCFYYGGRLVTSGQSSMMEFFVCYTAIVTSTPSTGACFNLLPDTRKGLSACKALLTLLSRDPRMDVSSDSGEFLSASAGRVACDNISFRYSAREDVQALHSININATPGKVTALVGPSGSGKSTVLSLIERFYDPLAGAILHNDVDIRQLNLRCYRKRTALISQTTTLFTGTIRENILLSSDATYLDRAIQDAALTDFIASLPNGLETKVGYRGMSLSGGQRQRVALARALLNDPKILLLDEATSALDTICERLVQSAINRGTSGRTTIAVAQRLSTVKHADYIYVIDHGRIVEHGTHNDLMHEGGLYATMIRIQEFNQAEEAISDSVQNLPDGFN